MVTLKLPFAALLTDKALLLGSAIGTKGLGGIPGHPKTQSWTISGFKSNRVFDESNYLPK